MININTMHNNVEEDAVKLLLLLAPLQSSKFCLFFSLRFFFVWSAFNSLFVRQTNGLWLNCICKWVIAGVLDEIKEKKDESTGNYSDRRQRIWELCFVSISEPAIFSWPQIFKWSYWRFIGGRFEMWQIDGKMVHFFSTNFSVWLLRRVFKSTHTCTRVTVR